MNEPIAPNKLKYLMLGAGGIGLVLRTLYYATGVDSRGLLESFHLARILLIALTVAAAAVLIFKTRALAGPEKARDAFPQSLTAGLGCLPAGILILITTWLERDIQRGTLGTVGLMLGIAAGLSLLDAARCRILDAPRHWISGAIVCVYFTFRTVCLYRAWSSHPQLQDYLFYLGAYIALMIASYYHAAFSCGLGNHRALWIASLAAVYFCCLCMTNSPDRLLLFCCGLWLFTNLSCLTPRQKRQMPSMKLEGTP